MYHQFKKHSIKSLYNLALYHQVSYNVNMHYLFNIFMYIYSEWFMVFNATFNNISVISWWSVLLVEEIGVPRENHRMSV
jgi:hypothetical protein